MICTQSNNEEGNIINIDNSIQINTINTIEYMNFNLSESNLSMNHSTYWTFQIRKDLHKIGNHNQNKLLHN